MAKCKDCIHYDVCQYHIDEETEMTVTECGNFKNKADFVEVEKAAEILAEQFGDMCPCNFNDIDEWLPYVCDHNNICDCSAKAGWEQFIKHYGERK